MRLTLLLLLLLTPPAYADQFEYKGGLNHTYLRKNPPPTEQPAAEGEEASPSTPTTKVWEKYKALAAGQPEQQQEAETTQPPTAPTAPEPPQKPTGITAILKQYQTNKAGRSQMRSLTMQRPEAPKVETPVSTK
ncbi:MAG: hypothetical protein ACRBCT_08940 [Alphaproteobacteria bacterium]